MRLKPGAQHSVRPVLTHLMLWGLTRVPDDPHPLASPTRLAIYKIVAQEPGIPARDIAARLGIAMGTLGHHLDLMSKAGLVESKLVGRRRVVYLPQVAYAPDDNGLLHEKTARAIALFVLAHPRIGILDLIDRTGLTQRVVYYHVKRLVDAGLLTTGAQRGYGGLEPTAWLYDLLREL